MVTSNYGGTRPRGITADGYALLAVLWICVAAGALSFAISAAGHDAIAAPRNRIALSIAAWNSEACLAQVRAVLTDQLGGQTQPTAQSPREVWGHLDRTLRGVPFTGDFNCQLSVRAVGSRIDVNAIDETTLVALLRAVGLAPGQADSAAAAVLDWKDADEAIRPAGAERDWYEKRGRTPPSNHPFVSVQELHLVRGLDSVSQVDSVLDVEPGPVALNHAPAAILALIPGFSKQAVDRVLDARTHDAPLESFHDLAEVLTGESRDSFDRASAQLGGLVLLEPIAWVITVRSTVGRPPVTCVVEARVVPGGKGVLLARRRSWIQ